MPANFTPTLLTSRAKASYGPQTDGAIAVNGPRSGKYGEQFVQPIMPGLQSVADEGSFFVATNPTIGTAVTSTIQTSFSDTTTGALFALQNRAAAGNSNVRIYPLWIRLVTVTVPASTTIVNHAIKVENVIRTPSANSTTIVPVNANSDDATQSVATLYAFAGGHMTMPASGATARTVARGNLGGLPITGDELVVAFGSVDLAAYGSSATAARKLSPVPPVIIGPQATMTFSAWFTSNATTAGTFEYELAWIER